MKERRQSISYRHFWPEDLHFDAWMQARKEGIDLQDLIIKALERYLFLEGRAQGERDAAHFD